MNHKPQTNWKAMSPEERERIEFNRSLAPVSNPFNGKNRAQRYRVQSGFIAMLHKFAPGAH